MHLWWILYQLSHRGSPRILEWVTYSVFSGSSQPRNQTKVSCIAGGFFTNWVIRGKILAILKLLNIYSALSFSPVNSKGNQSIKPVNPKGNQSWIFIGGTDAEADSPILWPHDAKAPDPGNVEGKRGRWWQTTRWLDGITDSVDN